VSIEHLITEHLDIWTAADTEKKSGRGRGSANSGNVYGIKKLRELILELAVRGKLVPQDPNDEPASELLKRIQAEKAKLIAEGKIKKSKPLADITDDEKPFELPINWKWAKLGLIGYTQTGATPSKSNSEYFGSDIPFIKPGDIYPNYIEYSNEGLSFYGAEKSGRIATSNSLLMVCIGTIGKCNLVQTDCSFNQQINSVTPYIFNSNFLLAVCRSVYFNAEAWNRSSSTTIAILNKSNWEEIYIPIPPIAEQQRIVAKVDELMALCDQLENQHNNAAEAHEKLVAHLLGTLTQSQNAEDFNANWQRIAEHFDALFTTESSVNELKQTLLQLAVMGKLVPQDPNDEPASELLKRIQAEKAKLIAEGKIKKEKPLASITEEEKPFELPVGWEWARLIDIIKISSGDGLTSDQMDKTGEIPVYGGNGITGYHSIANVNTPTLVIGRVGYYCGSIHVTPEFAWVTDNAFITKFSKENISMEFLYWLLKITNLKENESATAQPVISGRKVYPIVIALPPLLEQRGIVAKIAELMAICDQLKIRITEANELQRKIADVVVENAI
jgi:type I restriction enzyme S subunit